MIFFRKPVSTFRDHALAWIGRVEQALGIAVALAAATILLFEVGLLFVGVIARYFFHRPLGPGGRARVDAVRLAFRARRGAHDAPQRARRRPSSAAPAGARRQIETVTLLVAAFVLLIAHPAIEYASTKRSSTRRLRHQQLVARVCGRNRRDPDRGVLGPAPCHDLAEPEVPRRERRRHGSRVCRALACPSALPRARQLQPRDLLHSRRRHPGGIVPIAFAFGIATVGYVALATRAPLTVIVSRMDEGMSHLLLLSIPLFVFLGILIDMTGMARAMVGFLASLLGHVRGGLSYVLLGAMYLVSGISGAKAADMAAVAPVLFPEMKARGMKPGELVSLLASSGAMAETIPERRADCHRLGRKRLDRGAVHRWPAAGGGARAGACDRRVFPFRRRCSRDAQARDRSRDRKGLRHRDPGADPAVSHPRCRSSKASRPRSRSPPSASPTRSSPAS